MKQFQAKYLALCALFAALTAVCSQIQIPLPAIPINLALFAVLLCAGLLRPTAAVLAMVVYVVLGLVGVPVFAGMRGGMAVLFGKTGGYILGYILAALVVALLRKHWGDSYWKLCLSMAIGVAVCYLFGTVWYMILTGTGLWVSLLNCVFPFLIGDALKILLAALLTIRLKAVVK